MPTISSVTSPEPNIAICDDDSNDPTFPYGNGAQQPFVPPSLNYLNLPPSPFIILATMAVVIPTDNGYDENYRFQSLEPSKASPISTRPMNVSTIDGWETPHTTTDDNFFYSEDEPKRVCWPSPLDETFHSEVEPPRIHLLSSPTPPSPPHKTKRKLEMGMSFRERRGVSQHVCETFGQPIPPTKDIPRQSTN